MHTPSDPQKYLRRNFYGKYSQSGVPFLDGRCDLQSTNLIIYGHNMKNGTMFSDLKKYVDRDFLNAHRTVKFETEDGIRYFTVTNAVLERIFKEIRSIFITKENPKQSAEDIKH